MPAFLQPATVALMGGISGVFGIMCSLAFTYYMSPPSAPQSLLCVISLVDQCWALYPCIIQILLGHETGPSFDPDLPRKPVLSPLLACHVRSCQCSHSAPCSLTTDTWPSVLQRSSRGAALLPHCTMSSWCCLLWCPFRVSRVPHTGGTQSCWSACLLSPRE